MRVLVLSQMYPKPYNDVDGIFVHNQVKELIKKGCEVRVVSPERFVPFPLNYIIRKWQVYRGVKKKNILDGVRISFPRYVLIPRARLFWISGLLMYYGIKTSIKSLYQEFAFDIIHAHVALPEGFAAVMLKQEYRVPVILTIHGADLQKTILRNRRCKDAVGKVFEQADHIITVSDKLKGVATNNYGCEGKTTTIPNGIFPYKCKRNVRTERKIILSVSNLIPSKGVDLNLKAFAPLAVKYPDLVYKIIGDGSELLKLKRMVRQLNIPEQRVCFMGQLSNREVIRHMSESDIFSLPSWQEGFGVVYIEAMSQGRPVIACKGEGIEDVIEHGENGFLVKPRDVDSLLETLDYLLSNPGVAEKVGETARKTVLNNYTWEQNAEKTLQLYNRVLEG